MIWTAKCTMWFQKYLMCEKASFDIKMRLSLFWTMYSILKASMSSCKFDGVYKICLKGAYFTNNLICMWLVQNLLFLRCFLLIAYSCLFIRCIHSNSLRQRPNVVHGLIKLPFYTHVTPIKLSKNITRASS